ncbi:hypothetical protein ACPSLZ_22600 [Vibrio campbellii]|uniref:hypothetical protein n=1 Tax=Vibrio campbellii TaxID=680 RepID=UPI003CE5875A
MSGNLERGFIEEYKPTTRGDKASRKASNFAASNHQRESILIFRDAGYYSFNAAHLALLYCSYNTTYHSLLFSDSQGVALIFANDKGKVDFKNNTDFAVTWNIANYYSQCCLDTPNEYELYNQYFHLNNSSNRMWFLELFKE